MSQLIARSGILRALGRYGAGLTSLCFLTSVAVCAEPIKLTIWQNEARFEVQDGDTLPLNRGPFFVVLPLSAGEELDLAVGVPPVPVPLEAFGAGRGMAGPYGGTLFLDWEAFHLFYYHPDDPGRRADLWDRPGKLAYFRVRELMRRTPEMDLAPVPFESAPDLIFVVRKDGSPELRYRIHWATQPKKRPRQREAPG